MNLFNFLDEEIVTAANSTWCGGVLIPNELFNIVATIIKMIKIVVPILLIIWGMLDFAKSVVAKKEEDAKKYQKAFINRLISAAVVFLIVFIVQFAVNLMTSIEDKTNEKGETVADTWSCSKKFINGVGTGDSADNSESAEKA